MSDMLQLVVKTGNNQSGLSEIPDHLPRMNADRRGSESRIPVGAVLLIFCSDPRLSAFIRGQDLETDDKLKHVAH